MKKLLFTNPEMHGGINITVRRGRKWLRAEIGEKLMVCETGKEDEPLNAVECLTLYYLPFYVIPPPLLEFEHDPSCRTKQGLFKAMRRAYPGFHAEEPVTVIIFEPVPNDEKENLAENDDG